MNVDFTKITTDLILLLIPIITAYVGIRYKSWAMARKANSFMLKYHSMFNSLSNSKREVKRWNIQENRQVFVDALIIQIECWQKKGFELAETIDSKIVGNSQLEIIMNTWANGTIDSYNFEWQKTKIPHKIIKIINAASAEKTDRLFYEISTKVHNDNQYPFYKTKTTAILDILSTLLAETINDFNQLIYREHYNGTMLGVYYNELPVSDIEYAAKFLKKN